MASYVVIGFIVVGRLAELRRTPRRRGNTERRVGVSEDREQLEPWIVELRVVVAERGGQFIAEVELQLGAPGKFPERRGIAYRFADRRRADQLDVAVRAPVVDADAEADALAQRARDESVQVDLLEAAVARVEAGGQRLGRSARI